VSTTPRILFVSQHAILDMASGAALATRDLLELLASRGWQCGAVCGPTRDGRKPEPLVDDLARLGLPVESRNATDGGHAFRVHHVRSRGVPITFFDPDPTTPSPQVAQTFAGLVGRVAERFEPEVILTYGGDPATRAAVEAVRKPGVKVVFNLRNFAYRSAAAFRGIDAVIVPSAFARDHYRTTLGLECVVLPGPIVPDRVVCERIVPRYATFVNPLPQKGVVWVAGLIAALAASKSPVRWLVVEGRAGIERLGRCGIDLAGVSTVRRLRNTPDPWADRKFELTAFLVHPNTGNGSSQKR